ncbi:MULTISPECIES: nickel ABC transporter permease [unclassified Paenibacillus]|uniref:nickel ABC transporter permease n=1 Tax=unclassified Paenibacillus TaxID=185978 RepID=UPI0009FB8456|nr:nickel ABC transporter permease [Paenibacillus sp. FSL H7-0331]
MSIFKYLLIRIAVTIPVLLGVTLLIFSLLRFIPGDPAQMILLTMFDPGATVTDLDVDAAILRKQLGLDQPFAIQYLTWLKEVVSGNLGTSFRSRTPITEELWVRIPATLELAGAALVVMLVIALPSGIAGAVFHRRPTDHITRFIALMGVSVPNFFLGLVLVYCLSYLLGWFPTLGRGSWQHLVLPALTLGTGLAATTSRLLRTSLLEVFSKRYMVLAEAKGLPRSVIVYKHALRNALIPVITSFGMIIGGLLGGAVIIETVFSWPGIGRYVVDAINGRDYPVIQAFALLMAVTYVMINVLIDIIYRWIDPRVRIEEGTHG